MSHVANVEMEIKDLEALEVACKKLGLTFIRGQKKYKWYGKFMDDWHTKDAAAQNGFDPETFGHCEHVIKVPNSDYEIGIVKNPNGTGYIPLFDKFGDHGKAIEDRLGGLQLTKLKNEYTVAVATRQLVRQGYRVRRTERSGRITIRGERS